MPECLAGERCGLMDLEASPLARTVRQPNADHDLP
jgi:hypothetical protein